MSDNKRPSYEVFQSPVVELVYPWITQPDTRYNKQGVYQTKLRLSFEAAQDLIAQAERIRDAEFAKLDPQKASTYTKKDVYDVVFTEPAKDASEEEKEAFVPEPTNLVDFKAKLNRVVTPKEGEPFEQSVIVVDADEAPLTLPIWGGTKALVRGQMIPWVNAAGKQVGCTLRMKAVKVLDLKTGEGSTWGTFDKDASAEAVAEGAE